MKAPTPKRALQFLRWFCHEDHIEEIEGNLLELHDRQSATSEDKANWEFCKNVLLHFRPTYIRSFNLLSPNADSNSFNLVCST